jgi:hypothetical protein
MVYYERTNVGTEHVILRVANEDSLYNRIHDDRIAIL